MNTPKAIETQYQGYRFRSRTEARWAVFFTQIGFRYQYEDEGYTLSNGRRYLPDFKLILPNERIVYAEVKPTEFDDLGAKDIADFRKFVLEVDSELLVLPGIPEFRAYNLIRAAHPTAFSAALFQDYDPFIRIADEYWFQYLELDTATGRLQINQSEVQMAKSFGDNYVSAIKAARSARFEHGESPA